jgi:thiol-disulfide isomerase/thioredoxin
MKVMHRRLPLLVAVSAILALTGCSGRGAVRQDVAGSNGYLSGDLALQYIPVGHRHAPASVTGELLDGRPFDLASWRGHVVVVNFWGSWCAECHSEAAALQQVHADDAAEGVQFLGVDIRDDVASATAYDKKYRVTYPSLNDPSNLTALAFRAVSPNAVPTTIVLDRSGRIAARQSGEILYTQLRDLVNRVLAEPA